MKNTVRTLQAVGLSLAADIGTLADNIEAAVQAAGTDTDELRKVLENAIEDSYDVATKHNMRYWDMVTTGSIRTKKLPLATDGSEHRDNRKVR